MYIVDEPYTRNLIKDILRRKSLKIHIEIKPEFISVGSYGHVYKISDNKVIKFTTDPSEIRIAKILEGKDLKYTVKIHKVFQDNEELPFYIMDLLRKPDFFERVNDITIFDYIYKFASTFNLMDIEENEIFFPTKKELIKFKYSVRKTIRNFLKNNKNGSFITNHILELLKYNILSCDIHTGNIMINNDIPIVIDVSGVILEVNKEMHSKKDIRIMNKIKNILKIGNTI